MAVRPIDGNALIEWLRPYLHTGEAIPADVVIEDIRSMPTLTPQNEPLTNADRIRGMSDDYDLDRLRELVEADREGRCVVLPCKIGDTLYRIQRFKRGKNWRKEAEYIRTVELNKNNFWRVIFEGELGETVFLTREAAEAALKGDRHEQNL